MSKVLRVEMISTGDEVLQGEIVDTNAAWLAQRLSQSGVPLTYRATTGDNLDSLVRCFTDRSLQADIIIVNGGLGPTCDDLSAEAAAYALNQRLVVSTQWLDTLQQRYTDAKKVMPQSNIKQALLPEFAELIDNPVGTACGFRFELNGCLFLFTPGVPIEFKTMIEQQIIPYIQQRFAPPPAPICLRITSFGLTESGIADRLAVLNIPVGVVIGYRSALPFIEIKVSGSAVQHSELLKLMNQIADILEDNIVFSGSGSLPEQLGDFLALSKITLSLSETFTGGVVAATLQDDQRTALALRQGWVIGQTDQRLPDNQKLLGHAIAMAEASRERTGADLGLSTSRILLVNNHIEVAVALADRNNEFGQRVKLNVRHAAEQRVIVTTLLLDMLRRYLESRDIFGHYEWIELLETVVIPKSGTTNEKRCSVSKQTETF
ncbi:CinA family nicotinamide mononucleotide deamidase-related protein [Plesiomonas sp.]|uniref:CinA family nicotinamide mononucleotide deamidase-related protein n=1 Tax=Plesiomonas sp. TaxID=2486279 RepID=UPI003F417DAE